jgi:hypothetical protein
MFSLAMMPNDTITEYSYDDNDRLLTETCPEPCRRDGDSYTSDDNGNMLTKTVNGTDMTRYVVDKNRPYAQVPSASSGQDWKKNI